MATINLLPYTLFAILSAFLDDCRMVKPQCENFRMITAVFFGVRIFQIFAVVFEKWHFIETVWLLSFPTVITQEKLYIQYYTGLHTKVIKITETVHNSH